MHPLFSDFCDNCFFLCPFCCITSHHTQHVIISWILRESRRTIVLYFRPLFFCDVIPWLPIYARWTGESSQRSWFPRFPSLAVSSFNCRVIWIDQALANENSIDYDIQYVQCFWVASETTVQENLRKSQMKLMIDWFDTKVGFCVEFEFSSISSFSPIQIVVVHNITTYVDQHHNIKISSSSPSWIMFMVFGIEAI